MSTLEDTTESCSEIAICSLSPSACEATTLAARMRHIAQQVFGTSEEIVGGAARGPEHQHQLRGHETTKVQEPSKVAVLWCERTKEKLPYRATKVWPMPSTTHLPMSYNKVTPRVCRASGHLRVPSRRLAATSTPEASWILPTKHAA